MVGVRSHPTRRVTSCDTNDHKTCARPQRGVAQWAQGSGVPTLELFDLPSESLRDGSDRHGLSPW